MTTNVLAATVATPKVLASTRPSAITATTVYTVPASTGAKIFQGTISNTHTAAVTVSLSVVPSGGAVDGTHVVISSFSLAPGDVLPLKDYLGGAMLGAGDFVSVTVSVANVVCVLLTGVETS